MEISRRNLQKSNISNWSQYIQDAKRDWIVKENVDWEKRTLLVKAASILIENERKIKQTIRTKWAYRRIDKV
jgi:hypothetical protein